MPSTIRGKLHVFFCFGRSMTSVETSCNVNVTMTQMTIFIGNFIIKLNINDLKFTYLYFF